MVEVVFDLNQTVTVIQARPDEPFQDVVNKFIQKTSIDPNSIYYIANAQPVDLESTVEKQMNQNNKQNKKLSVLVNSLEQNDEFKEEVIVQSKDIICPECKEPCRYTINNGQIKLLECINNHTSSNIKFVDFWKTQEINISEIICDICKFKNKGNSYNHEFFFCLSCKKNICLLCKPKHDSNHNIIKYDQKNYICQKHNDVFIKYCEDCHMNICFSCDTDHAEHKTITLVDLKPDLEESKKRIEEIKLMIDKLTTQINEITNKFNELIKDLKIYYEINNNILKNYEVKNRNYQVLQNVNEIINNKIFEKIKAINDNNDLKHKLGDIIDLYNNINDENKEIKKDIDEKETKVIKEKEKKDKIKNSQKKLKNISLLKDKEKEEKLNEMTSVYYIKNKDKIRIFGCMFVVNNKDNCYLMINGVRNELGEYLILNNNKDNTMKIKLIEIKPITNMTDMFRECSALISLPDFHNWNTKNVVNMNSMFNKCSGLKTLPDISIWDTENVTDMNSMFYNCASLESLPDISKWDTKNVTNMCWMFRFCKSLKSLPDISKWDTKNVIDMNHMFTDCKSLKSFPDISKWIINKKLCSVGMFEGVNKKIIPKNLSFS